jgi:hypothetical protein
MESHSSLNVFSKTTPPSYLVLPEREILVSLMDVLLLFKIPPETTNAAISRLTAQDQIFFEFQYTLGFSQVIIMIQWEPEKKRDVTLTYYSTEFGWFLWSY